MDSDQEVTREPFENDEQDGYESDNNSHVSSNHQIDQPAADGHLEPSENDETPSCDIEDIKYAKSFGINLKVSKSQIAYDRLINSDCFKKAEIEAVEQPKPVIKTSVTSDCIYHKGTFYQKGDIVALCDQDDGKVYFAQIRGFLQDQFCEKSASLNWLIPNRPTSRKFFDPSAYSIGLIDTQLRKLDCMTFVRHCPHDYYIDKYYQDDLRETSKVACLEPSYSKKGEDSYIWTSMRPSVVPNIGPKKLS